jgi:antitoxin component of MazEF toxin-antitoxin module
MTQKVIRIGKSQGITIPKDVLKEMKLKAGDRVVVEFDKKTRKFSVVPSRTISDQEHRIAELTLNFVNRYRKDLEELARK